VYLHSVELKLTEAVLKTTITGDGVWRIRRKERSSSIEVFRVEETGHGEILSDEFINWRIKLALNRKQSETTDGIEVPQPMEISSTEAPG
jgi:RAT1-interacting protein